MRKLKARDIAEIIGIALVFIISMRLGYLSGEVLNTDFDAEAIAKAHIEQLNEGYNYCPYCGEELKKEVK